jgi:hypothetical protein
MDGRLKNQLTNYMKQLIIALLASPLLISCGGSASGTDLSKEVCECYKKANGLPATDPNRTKEQDACIQKQGEAWKKVKDDKDEADKFNQAIADCSRGIIEESTR